MFRLNIDALLELRELERRRGLLDAIEDDQVRERAIRLHDLLTGEGIEFEEFRGRFEQELERSIGLPTEEDFTLQAILDEVYAHDPAIYPVRPTTRTPKEVREAAQIEGRSRKIASEEYWALLEQVKDRKSAASPSVRESIDLQFRSEQKPSFWKRAQSGLPQQGAGPRPSM